MNPIRRLRFQKDVSQQILAAQAHTSQPTIALYETEKKSPTLETLEKLAQSMGLTVAISYVPPLTHEDKRSLAYHHAILQKIKKNPEKILTKAKQNLKLLSPQHPHAKNLFDLWAYWLKLPQEELIHCCLDQGLLARDMRQVTPFAGVLSAKERMDVIKKFRAKEHKP
jgi:transcriptional regulator with XRE-family HTH domain